MAAPAAGGAVIALFLHIEKTVRGQPWGSVTLLEYPIVAQDVGVLSELSPALRKRHVRQMVRRYTRNVRYCSIQDVLIYLKAREVN